MWTAGEHLRLKQGAQHGQHDDQYLVTPMIVGRSLLLNPVVIFIGVLFWAWMWGGPGALLAVPILVTAKIVCDHIEPLAPVGEFLAR